MLTKKFSQICMLPGWMKIGDNGHLQKHVLQYPDNLAKERKAFNCGLSSHTCIVLLLIFFTPNLVKQSEM